MFCDKVSEQIWEEEGRIQYKNRETKNEAKDG